MYSGWIKKDKDGNIVEGYGMIKHKQTMKNEIDRVLDEYCRLGHIGRKQAKEEAVAHITGGKPLLTQSEFKEERKAYWKSMLSNEEVEKRRQLLSVEKTVKKPRWWRLRK